ncbi:MAG: hypothetical protein KGH64_05275 [Candidatus Micrarchaeota archaeon]|nr:hypothetical protein [Candidatus Micrarchaeota archaeon]
MPTEQKLCGAIRKYGATIGAVHTCSLKSGHKGRHYCAFHESHFDKKMIE